MEDTDPPPLILCMENASGEEVSLKIEPQDDFRTFLDKAKALLGFEVDINSITHNQPVCLTDNAYQFILNAEQNLTNTGDMGQTFDQMLEQSDSNDLVYILDDGTQIRASQIHFDNEDPPVDLTAENIPFVKHTDCVDELDIEHLNIEEKNYNIVESPVSRWSSKNTSPKCSFVNSLPFKLVCNNTSAFDAQFTKYLEASAKTYATLNPVANRNRSPRSLIKDNFKKLDDVQRDTYSYTREDVLNMFKDSPVASLPYENQERRHVRKTDPSRLHKSWNRPTYVDIDGVLIGGSESQICFICGKHVDKNADKLYLFDNEDQKIHRCSPQKKMSTQLKIICEDCLNENFKPSRMKSANQFLNSDEYLVIRNNQQYIFQKTKNFKYNVTKMNSAIDKHELIKFEIGSDGEIVTKPVDDARSDVMIVKDERGSSSDVEIVEPESEIDQIVDNLDDADEEVKKFLGKYQCDAKKLTELKCRFCDVLFPSIEAVIDHGEVHKHDLDDGDVYPCPLCDYGYANFKWLKGHLKAAHDMKDLEEEGSRKVDIEIVKEVSDSNCPDESSPIARRTRSSSKKTDFDKNGDPEKKSDDEDKIHSTTELKEAEVNRIENTEIKIEEKTESSDDEIWIVHTADDEAAQELQRLIDAAKGEKNAHDGNINKTPKCLNCSQMFTTAEGLSVHKCRRRGRKRRTGGNDDNVICIPTEADFYKRAQGRPRTVNMSNNNDLLVPRCRKKKSKEGSSDAPIGSCHNCSESFTSKVRLKFHMQFHSQSALLTSTGQYCCTDCDDTTFATETELFDHVHFQHGKQKRWQCPVDGCGKTFYLRATLTKHSRTHTDTRRYVCVTCGKRFLDKQTLDEHGVTHLQIKPFQCHICLKQLTRRSRLRMHLRAHHEELAPTHVLVCAVCSRAFRDHIHAQEHATKSPECIEAFASELKEEAGEATVQLSPTSGLVRHTVQIAESPKLSKPIQRQVASPVGAPLLSMLSDDARSIIRVVEIEKAFRCEFCEDVFYQEEGLNTHRVIHKGVKNPFTCHICKVSFATYSRCTTHKTTHGFYKRPLVGREPSTAETCLSATPTILGYGDFPVVKHFLCEDCGRSYLHWTYLQVHRRMKHANENFLYKCNQCELTFPNSWSVAYHRKKVHGKTEPNGTATRVAREDYRIPCRDCDEVLPNKTALYKHRKKEHSDMTLKMNCKPGYQLNRSSMHHSADSDVTAPASCAHCGLTFAHAPELHTHLKSHHGSTDERDCATCGVGRAGASGPSGPSGASGASGYGCGVCGRAFRTSAMRTEHLRTHTDERPYPCDLCPLAFRRSSAMRNHRLIHSGVRPWPCARCPKRFRVRSDLRTHLRLKHPATMAVIEIEGLNPSPEDVVKYLTMNNISQEKVLELSMISFPKGTSNIVPNSTRALSMLSNVPRTQLAIHRPTPPQPPVEEFQPVRRGRGIAKNPRRPKILRGADDSQDTYPGTANVDGQTLSDINVQLLLRDGVLVNGNQMVQLQLDDPMLLE